MPEMMINGKVMPRVYVYVLMVFPRAMLGRIGMAVDIVEYVVIGVLATLAIMWR